MCIINPSSAGSVPLISVGAPGMIGSITAMNINGLAMGIDVLRSGACNSALPGFNSMLLTRYVIETTSTTPEAVQLIANSRRGATWLYPLCDADGSFSLYCIVLYCHCIVLLLYVCFVCVLFGLVYVFTYSALHYSDR